MTSSARKLEDLNIHKTNLNPNNRSDAILDAAQNVQNAADVKPVNQEHKNLLDIAQSIAEEMAVRNSKFRRDFSEKVVEN
jgi:hypothetical protein